MADVTTLFLDIGGVLGTNGWDHAERHLAAETFHLDYEDLEQRHRQYYPSHERGETTLDDYLNQVVFHGERPFRMEQFKEFMRQQSKPDMQMIEFVRFVKNVNRLKVAALSNEGRDLAEYRIQKFQLNTLMDAYFISCFVGIQKPDVGIYRMALDISQVAPEHALYVDDRAKLVEVGVSLRIPSIVHTSLEQTKQEFAFKGLIVT